MRVVKILALDAVLPFYQSLVDVLAGRVWQPLQTGILPRRWCGSAAACSLGDDALTVAW